MCSPQSVGVANQLFVGLIQKFLAVQCGISEMWPQDYGEIALRNGLNEYDFIVIGAGSAGSIVANRLSEISEWNVLLIEAGDNPPMESEIPGMYAALMKSPVDWQFYAQADNACKLAGSRGCYMARGKMLGGSSSMNGMQFVRGAANNYNEWAIDNPGWDYESVLPYFKKFEGNQNKEFVAYENGRFHNSNGPVKIDYGNKSPIIDVLKTTLKEAGAKKISDINADQHLGYVALQLTAFNGSRSSTAKVFLASAKNRKNLHVITHGFADKILFNDKNEVVGVEFTYKGNSTMKAFAKKEVIVSAGTIESPPLLMRSGIGPKKHLDDLNIPCKYDLPVGENYIDHVFVYFILAFNITTNSIPPLSEYDSLYQYVVHRSGPLIPVSPLAAFIDTTNTSNDPNIQLSISTYPRNSPKNSIGNVIKFVDFEQLREMLIKTNKKFDISTLNIGLVKPKSRGFITLKNNTNGEAATISSNYLSNPEDRATLLRAIKQQINFMKTEPFQKIGTMLLRIPLPECDMLEYQSDDYWQCYMKYVSTAGSHQVGTSKMGNDSKAVVDSRLKVRNIKGLRQIDAGVIPIPITGNTNAAVMMVGEKGADIIKEDYLGPKKQN